MMFEAWSVRRSRRGVSAARSRAGLLQWLLLGLCAAHGAHAQNVTAGGAAAPASARSDVRFDTLRPENGFRDWFRAYQSRDAFAAAGTFYSHTVGIDRGDGQQEMVAGYYRNLSDSLSSLVETSYLPNAQGLPEWSVLGQLGAMFGDGWGVQAGLRRSELGLWGVEGRRTDAHLGLLTLEKVWSNYRSQYTVYTSRRDNGGGSGGHRMSLDYLYGDRSTVGLTYGRAWATDPLMLPTLSSTGVGSNLGVTGEHWLSRAWTVNYDALFQQADDQSGLAPEIRVGLRLSF